MDRGPPGSAYKGVTAWVCREAEPPEADEFIFTLVQKSTETWKLLNNFHKLRENF